MHIGDAARASSPSADTIRYYEKAGMLPPVPRDGRGWRHFPPPLVEWLKNLARLRATGMPMADMLRFARLVHARDSKAVIAERLSLLRRHAERLRERRGARNACEAYLAHKIAIYGKKKAR
jgi:DNA-binding transcriptional MerR regulator